MFAYKKLLRIQPPSQNPLNMSYYPNVLSRTQSNCNQLQNDLVQTKHVARQLKHSSFAAQTHLTKGSFTYKNYTIFYI